ncbi:hypothetical protein G3N95_22015 [Paraburkholderia sp. Tr-20389]|uniref:SWIM zinc finger family protein n=1 Tax=Paraburkholderia sp. Tr-20389 TaxID=2703903 RepID=UPI001980BEE9|nr:DUF6880 family protein [Paraburkholderia sp. Tr-20389]MBN3755634.1 hypothetical protein [Paraburkholderia sp. Tr-20389]
MSKYVSLAKSLTLAAVLSLTDTKTFARGKAYFHDGAVSRLDADEYTVRAIVRGTEPYSVEMRSDHGDLVYYCNCPVGQTSAFCKHAVAVALSWLENSGAEVFQPDETKPKKPRKKRKTYGEIIGEYVETLDEHELRRWLLDAVDRDVTLRDKLLFAARSASADDLPALKSTVRQTTRVTGALFWQEAREYADGLLSLAEMLRVQLDGAFAAHVIELAELAIEGAETSLERIDDSGGYVLPAIHELAAVHLEACERMRPDPVALAERLYRLQIESTWGIFSDVLPAYEDSLGDAGLRRYRELVCNDWDTLPALGPGERPFDRRRTRIWNAMSALAEQDGDVDALIRIEAKDLTSEYRFEQVAQLCRQHGREEEALAWAERGLKESRAKTHDASLLDLCVDLCLKLGKLDKADGYAWRRFEQRPAANALPALLKAASATKRRDQTRERALAHMWAIVEREESKPGRGSDSAWHVPMRTEIVRVHLAEHEDETAWQVFTGGPTVTALCAEMAAVRGRTHPRDALAIYARLLPAAVTLGSSGAKYEDAAKIVRAIGELRLRLGEREQFAVELDKIRVEYRAKRNFIKLLADLR